MRNVFRIEAGDKTFVAYNSVLYAFANWKNGLIYGDYLVVFGGNEKLYKKTDVVSYNDNVAEGDLYVTYRAFVSKDEFPYDIDAIGLAPSINGRLSNKCTVELPADSYTVNVTLYLVPESDGPTFYPAENALVRSLLGMEAKPAYTVYGSYAKLPNKPIKCDMTGYTKLAFTDTGTGIRVRRGSRTDFTIGNPPYVRFNAAYASLVDTTAEYVAKDGGFVCDAVEVKSLTHNGEATEFGSYPVVAKLHPYGKIFAGAYDESYKLINDPLRKHVFLLYAGIYFGIKEDGETELLGSYRGDPMLCTNGTIVSFTDRHMYISSLGNESIELPMGDKAAFSRGNGYDVFVLDQKTLYIYRYEDSLVEKSRISLDSEMKMTRFNDFAVVLTDGATFRMFTADGEIEAYDCLSDHIGEKIEDGCFYGDGYCGNVRSGEKTNFESVYGRFANTADGLYYLGENGNVKVGDFKIYGAATAGDTVYFLSNYKLHTYAIEPSGTFVSVNKDGDVSCEQSTVSINGTAVVIEIKQ